MKKTTIENLKLEQIQPSALNPRKVYDEAALQELADSIKTQGLLNPITVRPVPDVVNGNCEQLYEIICGERRWRAMGLLKEKTIAVIIRELNDDEAFEVMITENLQRQDIEPLDEATAYLALQGRGLSVADMSAKFGKSERYIRDRLKLNELIPIFKDALSHGKISLGGAIMLARLDEAAQNEFADDHGYEPVDDWTDVEAMSTQDIKDDIEDNFTTLDGAIFLPEEDWNKDQQPRLCSMCANNSSCQQSIWPELASKARCADGQCFKEKLSRYISYRVESLSNRLLSANTDKFDLAMAPMGSVILYSEKPQPWWSDEQRQRVQTLIDRYKKRFLILYDGQITVEYNDQNKNVIDRELETGDIIEGINLYILAQGREQQHKYFRIKYEQAEDESRQKYRLLNQYASLCQKERAFAIGLMRKYLAESFKRFDLVSKDPILKVFVASCARSAYYESVGEYKTEDGITKRLDTLENIEEWWDTFKDWEEQTPYGYALEKLVVDLKNDSLLRSLIERFAPQAAKQFAADAHDEFEGKKKAVEDELRELGYDTKGDPLPESEPSENESESQKQTDDDNTRGTEGD